jgi:hypothetical protein
MAKAKPEFYSGSILGINQEGEIVSLSVYRKGGSVRLSRMFPNGTTYDHPITLPGRTPKSEAYYGDSALNWPEGSCGTVAVIKCTVTVMQA